MVIPNYLTECTLISDSVLIKGADGMHFDKLDNLLTRNVQLMGLCCLMQLFRVKSTACTSSSVFGSYLGMGESTCRST